MHCEWSNWGQWSKCTKSCGGGTQERRRTEATTAKHGGNGCDGSNTGTQSCKNQNCPGKVNLTFVYNSRFEKFLYKINVL